MYLVSTGKSTVLSNFADLESKSIYQHANEEPTDFQFYPKQRIFVEVNKSSGIEILRIRHKSAEEIAIQRVRKVTIDNLFSSACAKQSLEEIAIGLCNGQVKLYNYKSGQFVHRFSAENLRSSVLCVDYNASDEYIASVLENGQINIYGTKTHTKIETVIIDGNSTLARFHPTKRFHLAVASYRGCVTIYDVQSKRKVFNAPNSHDAPCRDLCMIPAVPESLISVGYDCIIKVFDMRRKTQLLKITSTHPLSTVSTSECGIYFCVGNLKGEVITYDMRNTKSCLVNKKVHDCAITRLSFVPSFADGDVPSYLGGIAVNQTEERVSSDLPKPTAVAGIGSIAVKPRDSFCDFLDYQSNSVRDKMPSRFHAGRESFDWDALTRKPNIEDRRTSALSPGSISSTNNSVVSPMCNSIEAKLKNLDLLETNSKKPTTKMKFDKKTTPTTRATPLLDLSNEANISQKVNSRKLLQIAEEEHILPKKINNNNSEQKENDMSRGKRLPKPFIMDNSTDEIKSATCTELESTFSKQLHKLNTDMNERFQQLEAELKMQADTNKWQIFTQAANLWAKQTKLSEDLRNDMAILMQTDEFVSEFIRLKQENSMLKNQLLELQKK